MPHRSLSLQGTCHFRALGSAFMRRKADRKADQRADQKAVTMDCANRPLEYARSISADELKKHVER